MTFLKKIRMKKLITILLILNLFVGYIGFGQQTQSSLANEIGSLQNMETFINRKLINPTNLTDSNNFMIDFAIHEQWIGNNKATNGFFLSGETGLSSKKCSIGLNIDFKNNGLWQHHSIISSIKYDWLINTNSKFELGLNMGFWQYRLDVSNLIYPQDPLTGSVYASEWQTIPRIDLGINYKYKAQSIGLSYNNMLTGTNNLTVFKGLILNYQNIYTVSKKITLIPEMYACLNSENTYGIIILKLDYSKRITCGLLYNTKNSSGFLISGIIKKRAKIGYYYNLLNLNHQTFNSHCLNLGFIIK